MSFHGLNEKTALERLPRPWAVPTPARAEPAVQDLLPLLLFRDEHTRTISFVRRSASARYLVRQAGGATLDGEDMVRAFPGDRLRPYVAVWALQDGGGRNRFLGYVWQNGRADGHAALKAELEALAIAQATAATA